MIKYHQRYSADPCRVHGSAVLPAISGLYGARVSDSAPGLSLLLSQCGLCPMLVLAFICGFFWDAQHTLGPKAGILKFIPDPVESLRFGYSIILYAMMGLLMQGHSATFPQREMAHLIHSRRHRHFLFTCFPNIFS